MERLKEPVRLRRMSVPKRDIARSLGMSPSTEQAWRKRLAEAGLLEGPVDELPDLDRLKAARRADGKTPHQEQSTIEKWRPRVAELVEKGDRPDRHPPPAGRVRSQVQGQRLRREVDCRPDRRRARLPTRGRGDPGRDSPSAVAQVDFGYAGRIVDPTTKVARRAWLFVMVLGFSRHMFCKVVFDQSTDTWLSLHVEAFEHFGGVPRAVVPDNLKAAVIRAAFGVDDDVSENRSFRELARHYGFIIDPTPPRAPEKKGKVERSVRYVTNAFLNPRQFTDVDDLNRRLMTWVVDVTARELAHAEREVERRLAKTAGLCA